MTVEDVYDSVGGFSKLTHTERIKILAWYLHSHKGKERFTAADIRSCYASLHMDQPSDITSLLLPLTKRRPREILKDAKGYALERSVRSAFDKKFGINPSTVVVDKLLTALPSKVSNPLEREFLEEALRCFRVQAYRASVVMTWNLVFSHLRQIVFDKHLAAFNSQAQKTFASNKKLCQFQAVGIDDFDEMKESEFILVASKCGVISSNVQKILEEKLKRRNMAAHPSNVSIAKFQAEDFISDLVNNVILKLA